MPLSIRRGSARSRSIASAIRVSLVSRTISARRAGRGIGGNAEHGEQGAILGLGADRDAHPAGRGIGAEAHPHRGGGEAAREAGRVGDLEEQEIAAGADALDLGDAGQLRRRARRGRRAGGAMRSAWSGIRSGPSASSAAAIDGVGSG